MATLKDNIRMAMTGRHNLDRFSDKVDASLKVEKEPVSFTLKSQYRFELRIGAYLSLHPNDIDYGMDRAAILLCRELYRDMIPLVQELQTAILERDLETMHQVADKMWSLSTRGEL